MTFNNWKELSINGNKLKRLVRVSDGLVLFELQSGPDYSEPFWVDSNYKDIVGQGSQYQFVATSDPTYLGLEYSYDKKNWLPIAFEYVTSYSKWWSKKTFSSRDQKTYFRSGSETPVNPGEVELTIQPYAGQINKPLIIGGNLHSFLCKNFTDIVDLTELSSCFYDFLSYGGFADARKLLMPAKVIGDSCYRHVFLNGQVLSATPKMSFDVEEIGRYGMGYAFQNARSFNGHLAFTSLKSVGPYGMYYIGSGSSLSAIEFPENQISVDYYGMCYIAQKSTNLKHVNRINVFPLSTYSLTRAFEGCTSLETVGGLSCCNSTSQSYTLSGIFNNCSSLVDVGELNIDSNGNSACRYMFNNCGSLSAIRGKMKLRGGSSAAEHCFNNCVIKDASRLSIEFGNGSSIGRYLFDGCTSLESMPVFMLDPTMSGTATAKFAYAFRNCKNLKYVTPLVEVRPQSTIYQYAFQNCTSMTDAPEIMLSSINSANCMSYMFDGCTSLSSVTVHFTSWPSSLRTTNWLRNVAPTGIFRCPAELEDKRGANFIPEGWTKVDL